MAVLTISREPYSGGSTLGQKIAERSGYSLFTKKDFTRIFTEYGLISFEDFYESPLNIWERVDELGLEYMNFLVKVIRNISLSGDSIILGRGSFAVFPGYSDVMNIRLWAPEEVRITRCMEKEGIGDRAEAAKVVERQDRLRQSFITHCFHLHKSDEANAFDLVINTAKAADDAIIDLVLKTAGSLESGRAGGLLTKDIPGDKILLDTILKVKGGR